MSVESIINQVIDVEGGFVDNKDDRGGATIYGITEAVARASGYHGPMQSMPRGIALDIYTRQYVVAPGFDKIATISPSIASELVDTGVNMGPGIPGPWLQRILTLMNQNAKLYKDLIIDGDIGPATLCALTIFLKLRGSDGEKVILRALNGLQAARYIEITETRPQNRAFIYGWLLGRVS